MSRDLRAPGLSNGRDIFAAHIEMSSEILAVVRAGGQRHRSGTGTEPSAYCANHSTDSFNSANTASFDNAEPCASNSLAESDSQRRRRDILGRRLRRNRFDSKSSQRR